LIFRVALAAGGGDVHQQIARYREHRGLFVVGVEAHEQDRVAVRGVVTVEGVLGAHAAVRAEDQKGLRAAAVDGLDHSLGGVYLVQLRKHLFRDTGDLV